MSSLPGSPNRRPGPRWSHLLAWLLPLLWLVPLRLATVPPGTENSNDAYYHVARADLLPEVWRQHAMPQMTLSLWGKTFYDKELGFHLLVKGWRGLAALAGWSPGPPFHLPALAVLALTLAAFALALCHERVPLPWLFSLLLVGISPTFVTRLLLLRPHVLALGLMLLATVVLSGFRYARRDGWRPVTMGMLFAWCYSNPQFVLLPAVAYWLAGGRASLRRLWTLPTLAALGVVAGLTIHPQFPNTFRVWKVQSVDVVRQILQPAAPVRVGDELLAPDRVWLLRNAGIFMLAGAALWTSRKRPDRPPLPTSTRAHLLMMGVTCAGLLLSTRAVEYAAPFSVLAAALVWRDRTRAAGKDFRPSLVIAAAVAVTFLASTTTLATWIYARHRPLLEPMGGFAEWARGHIPSGARIANPNWSDFPRLYYSAPQYRYSLGLDPMFGYARFPRRVAALEAFRTGQKSLTPRQLARITGARYAVLARENAPLARELEHQGWKPVYQGRDGWVFGLSEAPAPHPPGARS